MLISVGCLLISSGILAVLAKHRSLDVKSQLKQTPVSTAFVRETKSSPKPETITATGESLMMQLTREQFQTELANLDYLAQANDLDGFLRAADEIEKKWGEAGDEYYGRLMLNVSNLLANSFRDEKSHSLSQKYASEALARADSFSVRLETELLMFLQQNLAAKEQGSSGQEDWVKERSKKATLWLHAWQRIEKEINRNFNFNDRPKLNVNPPDESGLPPGANPKGIKDSKLRAQYEAAIAANEQKAREYDRQYMLKYLDDTFTKRVEEYLVRIYSEPPYNPEELQRYLIIYGINKNARERILIRVTKNISSTQ